MLIGKDIKFRLQVMKNNEFTDAEFFEPMKKLMMLIG